MLFILAVSIISLLSFVLSVSKVSQLMRSTASPLCSTCLQAIILRMPQRSGRGVLSCRSKTWGHICHAVRVHSLCSHTWWLYCFRDKFLVKGPYEHDYWKTARRGILFQGREIPRHNGDGGNSFEENHWSVQGQWSVHWRIRSTAQRYQQVLQWECCTRGELMSPELYYFYYYLHYYIEHY